MRDVIVLAGGASVMDYNIRGLDERGYLIAVNDAAIYTKCHIAFTMDRLWLEGRQLLLKTLNPPQIWYRKGTPKCFVPPPNWKAFEHSEDHPSVMTRLPGKLNGSNSGTCAINLAFQLQPERVFLFGFDMQRGPNKEKHWYPDYPWVSDGGGTKPGTYSDWANDFHEIARQFKEAGIDVFNVSQRSLITNFPRIEYTDFLRMT